MKKNYTIFISSSDKRDSVKEIYLSASRLRMYLFGLSFFALALCVFSLDYFLNFSSEVRYQKYQIENQSLKEQLQGMHARLKQVDSLLNQIKDFSHKMKVIVGISDVSPTHPLAIGPLSESVHFSSSGFDSHPITKDPVKKAPQDKMQMDIASLSSTSPDSILVYMDQLEKKSHNLHEDVSLLLETIYERRDIMNSIPSIIPARGWLSSRFGYRRYPFTGEVSLHGGIDIAASPGTPVYAPSDGVVVFANYKRGYGKMIVIDHGYDLSTVYAHLSDIVTSKWQKVKRGQVIGEVGNTGYSSGPHLHYEIRIANVPVDPSNYMLDSNP